MNAFIVPSRLQIQSIYNNINGLVVNHKWYIPRAYPENYYLWVNEIIY